MSSADVIIKRGEHMKTGGSRTAVARQAMVALTLASIATLSGCATNPQTVAGPSGAAEPPPSLNDTVDTKGVGAPNLPGSSTWTVQSGNADYKIVQVFYATDRTRALAPAPTSVGAPISVRYTSGRGDVVFGSCAVSIPHDHRMGFIERPSLWKLEIHEDPAKDIVLLKTSEMGGAEFFETLKQDVESSKGSSALVFVHGYNVTFEDAALRTAQLAYDLEFDGPTIFFSWPSRGTIAGYADDETNVQWATPDLTRLLTDVLRKTNVSNLYLVAHSMGSRALTGAFMALVAADPLVRKHVREVLLAAPDIDADVFKQQILPVLTGKAPESTHVTLYASSRDEALRVSQEFHGYLRAGESNKIVLAPGLESIDATAVDTGLLGHSYYGENKSILADMHSLINDHDRACNRFALQVRPSPIGTYCVIAP